MGNLFSSSTEETGNGQWNYAQSGSSSYSDGQNSGGQVFTNINVRLTFTKLHLFRKYIIYKQSVKIQGQVHHETFGNNPQGSGFVSISHQQPFNASPAMMTLGVVVVSALLLLALMATAISLRKRSLRQMNLCRRRRNPLLVKEAQLSVKRPIAEAMWNNNLLLNIEMGEIKLDR